VCHWLSEPCTFHHRRRLKRRAEPVRCWMWIVDRRGRKTRECHLQPTSRTSPSVRQLHQTLYSIARRPIAALNARRLSKQSVCRRGLPPRPQSRVSAAATTPDTLFKHSPSDGGSEREAGSKAECLPPRPQSRVSAVAKQSVCRREAGSKAECLPAPLAIATSSLPNCRTFHPLAANDAGEREQTNGTRGDVVRTATTRSGRRARIAQLTASRGRCPRVDQVVQLSAASSRTPSESLGYAHPSPRDCRSAAADNDFLIER